MKFNLLCVCFYIIPSFLANAFLKAPNIVPGISSGMIGSGSFISGSTSPAATNIPTGVGTFFPSESIVIYCDDRPLYPISLKIAPGRATITETSLLDWRFCSATNVQPVIHFASPVTIVKNPSAGTSSSTRICAVVP